MGQLRTKCGKDSLAEAQSRRRQAESGSRFATARRSRVTTQPTNWLGLKEGRRWNVTIERQPGMAQEPVGQMGQGCLTGMQCPYAKGERESGFGIHLMLGQDLQRLPDIFVGHKREVTNRF